MKVNPRKLFKAWIASIILTALVTALIVSWISEQTFAQDNTVQATVNESISYIGLYQPTIANRLETILEPNKVEPVKTVKEIFKITAYCPCEKCCGEWSDGITFSGDFAHEGVTIAADLSVLPLGTKVYIEGIGERIVQDKGGVIKGNRIDLFFYNHAAALNFGIQELEVEIIEWPKATR